MRVAATAPEVGVVRDLDSNMLRPATRMVASLAALVLNRIVEGAKRTGPPLSPVPLEEERLQLSQNGQDAVGAAPTTIGATFFLIRGPLTALEHVEADERREDVGVVHHAAEHFYFRRPHWVVLGKGELKVQDHWSASLRRLTSHIAMPSEEILLRDWRCGNAPAGLQLCQPQLLHQPPQRRSTVPGHTDLAATSIGDNGLSNCRLHSYIGGRVYPNGDRPRRVLCLQDDDVTSGERLCMTHRVAEATTITRMVGAEAVDTQPLTWKLQDI
mmetsp:Transcript_77888/g.167069  ORF Transcript_77888/g.167069 Transcript_77888/m.167069 type:complete len:271 (+) Transcript_77888:2331-3143(+)